LKAKTKGKNFSCNNATGNRKASDMYDTPYCLPTELLKKEHLHGKILEPACGNMAIVDVLKKNKYKKITAYDIRGGKDFLKETKHYDTIITNPPYSQSMQFIQKAKCVCDEFYFLLPVSYLQGKARYDEVYTDTAFPLRKIYVFTRFPMFGNPLRADYKIETGMMACAWYCFTKAYIGEPTIAWLDIDEYVLRKADR